MSVWEQRTFLPHGNAVVAQRGRELDLLALHDPTLEASTIPSKGPAVDLGIRHVLNENRVKPLSRMDIGS